MKGVDLKRWCSKDRQSSSRVAVRMGGRYGHTAIEPVAATPSVSSAAGSRRNRTPVTRSNVNSRGYGASNGSHDGSHSPNSSTPTSHSTTCSR